MSSLFKVKTKSGESYKIQVVVGGERKTITLGRMSKKAAELICSRVETINSCNLAGLPYPPDVAQWLGTVGDDLHKKLSGIGLIPARHTRTLATFLEAYKAERVDVKPNTIKAWNTAIKSMVGFLGDVPLQMITSEQAELYRAHLVIKGDATAYVSKLIQLARMFFNVARRRKLIDENPFQYVETGSQVNEKRYYYVTREETDRLIDACANAKERLIIALGRYAGLRIPSELVGLRWSEVFWGAPGKPGRFIVHAPKTERKGKAKRVVPIFNLSKPYLQLQKYMNEAWEVAPENEDKIFPEIHENGTMTVGYRAKNGRTTMTMGDWIAMIADRAGVILWEKPFQNLRASCSTDLADEYHSKVCAEWLGHTVQVADKHYRHVTESHFESATQNSYTENRGVDASPLESTDNPKNCAAKSVAAPAGNSVQTAETNLYQQSQAPIITAHCISVQEADSVQNGRTQPSPRIPTPVRAVGFAKRPEVRFHL